MKAVYATDGMDYFRYMRPDSNDDSVEKCMSLDMVNSLRYDTDYIQIHYVHYLEKTGDATIDRNERTLSYCVPYYN